jgi:prepilin-type N-terminal cleavage/methylation domain-containing protein
MKNGFTLIELMCYLTLLAFIALASMHWVVQVWKTCLTYEKKRVFLINVMAAHDSLLRDIIEAPRMLTQWKMKEPSRLIWRTNNHNDLCWMQEKDTLVRIEGIFDSKKQVWQKKAKNMVVPDIKTVQFDCHSNKTEMLYIDFTVANADFRVDNRGILMQRSLHANKG